LLRCVKYCAMGLLLIGLLLVLFVSPVFAAVEAVEAFSDSTWSNEIYYISSLSGYYGETVGYDDITIWMTAVDEYELYVNGERIDTEDTNDNNWATVEQYIVNVSDNTVNIGVRVVNHGEGNGNGLIMDIQAGSDNLGTTTKIREAVEVSGELHAVPVAWWCFDNQAKEDIGFGDDWYTLDFQDIFTDVGKTSLMRRAMLGRFNEDVEHTFNPGIEIITGYLHSNVDIGYTVGGGIALRRIEGENIALGKPAQDIKLTDGDLDRGFTYMSRPLGDTQYVDLGRIYRVNRMTLYTGGGNVADFERKSLRGYAVEISLDEFRWEEVGVIHEIGELNIDEGGHDNYSVNFPPEWARYVRYNVTETRIEMPNVGEIMMFGLGYALEGKYESPWFDLDSPDMVKNFDMVEWDGDILDGTKLTIQTQTKNGVDGLPSPWSAPSISKSYTFDSPEPATHFRYRINLETQDPFRTPIFKKLKVTYSNVGQPVTYADGYVMPNRVAMGADSTYTYFLGYTLDAGQNINQLVLSVPGYTTLNSIYCSDLSAEIDIDEGNTYSTIDSLYVTFANPVTDTNVSGADTLYISFDTKLLGNSHTFNAFLYNSTMNDGAGPLMVWENKELGSDTVIVSSLLKSILTNVKAMPKVFTPNNDGKNDFTVIEFTLAKVETNVMIKMFNTSGSLVATVTDEVLGNRAYSVEKSASNIGEAKTLPGYWDGKDEDGDLVPPGIYIYQVIADTDDGDVIEGGTVVVAY